MIVDFHCHAGRGDQLSFPAATDAPLGLYLRRARRAGIDRTVVMPAFNSDYRRANADLARLVARHPRRLIGFAFVHARRDAGRIPAMLAEAVEHGLRGVKVHGAEGLPTREVCAAARTLGLPVLVDLAGRASAVHMFAPQYPEVPFILAHLGSFTDDWRAQRQVLDQLVLYPNVFADTSGVRWFDYLVEAVERAGARKLLFGSDGPWLHPALELAKIRLLRLAPRDEALVVGGNALRLLRWQARRGARRPGRVLLLPDRRG
jgi:predicted TIM-barrel fold metal-dependent hydrolase